MISRFRKRETRPERVRLCVPGFLEVEGEGLVAVIGSLIAILTIALAYLFN
jgi:hypothetical protein